jgi:hypothetical protein
MVLNQLIFIPQMNCVWAVRAVPFNVTVLCLKGPAIAQAAIHRLLTIRYWFDAGSAHVWYVVEKVALR